MKMLFWIPSASGHTVACQPLLHICNAANLELAFVSEKDGSYFISKQTSVSSTGFLFQNKELEREHGFHESMLDLFGDWLSDKNYKIFANQIQHLEQQIVAYNPDLVLIDSFLSRFYFALPSFQSKMVLFNTQMNNYRDQKLPPLNSSLLYEGSIFNQLVISMAWIRINIEKALRPFHTFWQDSWITAKRFAQKNGYSTKDAIWYNKCFHPGIKNIPELILGYQSFDFPRSKPKVEQHYLAIQYNPQPNFAQNELEIHDQLVLVKEKGNFSKLVFCALGTLSATHNKKGSVMVLKKLVKLFQNRPEWCLVIASNSFHRELKESQGQNILVYETIAQVKSLPLFDLMITHAGANSVYECIHNEVPMLALPLNARWDQNGNAARIVYHNIGLRANVNRASTKELDGKIKSLLTEPAFKQNIKALKAKMVQEEQRVEVIPLLRSLGGR